MDSTPGMIILTDGNWEVMHGKHGVGTCETSEQYAERRRGMKSTGQALTL